MIKNTLKKIVLLMEIILLLTMFYSLNYYSPLLGDDYSYSFSWETGERIDSVSQIIPSQIAHYNKINGRCITHAIAQIYLLMGDGTFNVVNSLFFLLLLILIYFHAVGTFKNFSSACFFMLSGLLFLCTPAFGQSFLWITGAANYLYGILIILLFLIPYRIQVNGKFDTSYSIIKEIIYAVVAFILGVIAGWTNENNSVALIVFLLLFPVCCKINNHLLHPWNFTGLFGSIIGCIIMLTAPGTTSRLTTAGGSGGIVAWIRRFVYISCNGIQYLQLIIITGALLLGIYVYQNIALIQTDSIKQLISKLSLSIIFLVAFFASIYSMIVSPYFPERAWSGPVVFILIVVGNLYSLVDFSITKYRFARRIYVFIICIFCFAAYENAYFACRNVTAFYEQREQLISQAISNGEKSVSIPQIYGYSPYSLYDDLGDLSDDSSEWPNTAIAKYYGIDKIETQYG